MQTWKALRPERFNQGQGRNTRNGLVYLGYPFGLGDNRTRTAILPGHGFRVRCLLPRPAHADPEYGREELPLPAASAHPTAWRDAFSRGLSRIQGWLAGGGEAWEGSRRHPHLGPRLRWILTESGHSPERWDAALADAGGRMQAFRLRRAPDYQMVKDQVLAGQHWGGRPMRASPDRVSFGLPLGFRFTSVRAPALTLVPHDAEGGGHFERHGSLLHLRLVRIGNRVHPLFVRLDGAVPGIDPPAMVRGEARPLEPFATNAMDLFMDSLSKEQTHG